MVKFLLGAFLIAHGLVHAGLAAAPNPDKADSTGGAFFTAANRSWLLPQAGLNDAVVQWIGVVLVILTTLGFVVAGLGVFGVPGLSEVWRTVAVVSACLSLSLLIVFWHPWLVVGENVKQLRPGDEVLGMLKHGGFAQYAYATEDQVVLKPAKLLFEEAAAVPLEALTALQCLRDHAQIQPQQTVLINGASGGIDTFAVQIARSFGANVTGVCSTRNLDMVRSIGADQVIDYTQEDFTQTGQRYDLIFDAVRKRSFSESSMVTHR